MYWCLFPANTIYKKEEGKLDKNRKICLRVNHLMFRCFTCGLKLQARSGRKGGGTLEKAKCFLSRTKTLFACLEGFMSWLVLTKSNEINSVCRPGPNNSWVQWSGTFNVHGKLFDSLCMVHMAWPNNLEVIERKLFSLIQLSRKERSWEEGGEAGTKAWIGAFFFAYKIPSTSTESKSWRWYSIVHWAKWKMTGALSPASPSSF